MDFPNCSSEEYDQLFKIVILGDSTIGKSSLLHRFTQNKFKSDCKTTIGVDFNIENVEIGRWKNNQSSNLGHSR